MFQSVRCSVLFHVCCSLVQSAAFISAAFSSVCIQFRLGSVLLLGTWLFCLFSSVPCLLFPSSFQRHSVLSAFNSILAQYYCWVLGCSVCSVLFPSSAAEMTSFISAAFSSVCIQSVPVCIQFHPGSAFSSILGLHSVPSWLWTAAGYWGNLCIVYFQWYEIRGVYGGGGGEVTSKL